MSVKKYVFPIFRKREDGIDIKGNGFFVGNLFITAEHVVMPDKHIFYGEPYIIIGKQEIVLTNKVELKYKSLEYDDNDCCSGHEDSDRTDLCVYNLTEVEINSPLRLATSSPTPGQHLQCDFYHEKKDLSNPSQEMIIEKPLQLYFWETKAIVETEEQYFVGNFFGTRMKPHHPHQGSSGSPLYDKNNIVFGILHDGEDDFCGFYAAAHAYQLLRQSNIHDLVSL